MNNFHNPYTMQGNYLQELNNMRGRIDNQIQQVQHQQQNMPQLPMQQPTNLTQNFQLASNNNGNIRLVNGVDYVQKEIVLTDTYFLANSLNSLWIKNSRGDIRTFELSEIKPKDEKDLLIEKLQKEKESLNEDKSNEFSKSNGKLLYEQPDAEFNSEFGEPIETKQSADV